MYQVYSFQYTRYIHFPIPHDKHLTTGHYEVTYFHWAPLTCVVRTQHSSMRPLGGGRSLGGSHVYMDKPAWRCVGVAPKQTLLKLQGGR